MSESVEEERRGSMWPLGTTDDDDDVYTPSLSARLGAVLAYSYKI